MTSPYAAAYADPQGPGDSRPTALQIIHDNNMQGKLSGKVILVTGVSSGIGIETVRALSLTGARIIGTARDLTKAYTALSEVEGGQDVQVVEMDQSSLDSVRTAAQTILSKTSSILIMIANAGVMAIPSLQKSKDNFELHLATNHLSHFLLFQLLSPALVQASTPALQSRVVMVGAGWHRASPLPASGDYNFEQSTYDPWTAYARSKTANTYMANEIERRHGANGVHATSLHPGVILGTGVARHVDPEMLASGRILYEKVNMSVPQGAATTVYAAVSRELEGRGGVYLTNCSEAVRGEDDGVPGRDTFVSHTYHPVDEARLWEDSLRLVQVAE